MRISAAQRTMLRFGAVMCLVAVLPATLAALLIDSDTSAAEVRRAADPAAVALPDLGVFGGSVTVYGRTGDAVVAPSDLGCVLVDDTGEELNQAKVSHLSPSLRGTSSVTVDGEELRPLFEVRSYPDGARLACSDPGAAEPLAVSDPNTFGSAALTVRVVAALAAVMFFAVGTVALLALRRPRR